MEFIQVMALTVIRGVTEFLPVTNNLGLNYVSFSVAFPDEKPGLDLAVHFGSLAAILLYFRHSVAVLTYDWSRSIFQLRHAGQSRLAWAILISTLPLALTGYLIDDLGGNLVLSAESFTISTLFFALLLAWADKDGVKRNEIQLHWSVASVLIGIAQTIFLIPGASRLGSCITAGLLLGLDRETASRFAFLLAIPVTVLASFNKLTEFSIADDRVNLVYFMIGSSVSFLAALIAIHYFFKSINRFGMWPYVVFQIGISGMVFLADV